MAEGAGLRLTEPECAWVIWVRDQWRADSRAPSGFSLHRRKSRCSRLAVRDGLCTQHARIRDREQAPQDAPGAP